MIIDQDIKLVNHSSFYLKKWNRWSNLKLLIYLHYKNESKAVCNHRPNIQSNQKNWWASCTKAVLSHITNVIVRQQWWSILHNLTAHISSWKYRSQCLIEGSDNVSARMTKYDISRRRSAVSNIQALRVQVIMMIWQVPKSLTKIRCHHGYSTSWVLRMHLNFMKVLGEL